MTTEIQVLLDADRQTDIETLSREEREILFDNLALSNPDIPRAVIDDFADIQEEISSQRANITKPEIRELMMKQAILLSRGRGCSMNTIVIPIIAVIPSRADVRPHTHKESVRVSFDTTVMTVTAGGLDYIAPPSEVIDIIGVVINPMCAEPNTIAGAGMVAPLTALAIVPTTVAPLITNGRYTYEDAASACDGIFDRRDKRLSIAHEKYTHTHVVMFDGLTDAQISRTLSDIIDYLVAFDVLSRDKASAVYVYAQLSAAIQAGPAVKAEDANTLANLLPRQSTHQPIRGTEHARAGILDVLETIHAGKFAAVYDAAVIADVGLRGFNNIYTRAVLSGADSASVRDQLAQYKHAREVAAYHRAVSAKSADIVAVLTIYKSIIKNKLGLEKFTKFETDLSNNPGKTAGPDSYLTLLKPADRKLIEAEYNRRDKYLAAVANNKCPHVALYRKFRRAANTAAIRAALDELAKFFTKSTDMIKCKSCGFEIMCGHVREAAEMEAAGKNQTAISARLASYIDTIPGDNRYCRICGEIIPSLDVFSDDVDHSGAVFMDEEIKNFMWNELISLMRYIKTNPFINVSRLVSTMRDDCYPYIFDIEKQILKSRTNTADEIKAKKQLYVIIYGFAWLARLIVGSKAEDISFRGLDLKKAKAPIVAIIKHILDIILTSRGTVIREISNMTPELVKSSLIEAYRSITGVSNISTRARNHDIMTMLMMDPIYHYIYSVNTLDATHISAKAFTTFDMISRAQEMLGKSPEILAASGDIYASAAELHAPRWSVAAFDKLAPFAGKVFTADTGEPLDAHAQVGAMYRAYELFISIVKSKLHIEPTYIDASVKKDDPTAAPEPVLREPHEKLNALVVTLATQTQTLAAYKHALRAQGRICPKIQTTRAWKSQTLSLGRIYDEDGMPHIWDILVVTEAAADGPADTRECTRAAYIGEVAAGKHSNIVDRKCSVCSIHKSRVNELLEEKILASLRMRRSVMYFYRFFENRCLKGALHEFTRRDDDAICKKCTMTTKMLADVYSKAAMAFYKENKKLYDIERGTLTHVERLPTAPVAAVASEYAAEYASWSHNFDIVLDLAEKLGINDKLLQALGAVERQDYDDISTGAWVPPEVDERYSSRVYVIDMHIKNLTTEYNQLRFFARSIRPPAALVALVDASGIARAELGELPKILPDVFNDYTARFAYVQKNKKPREVVAFCLQFYCEMCLKIYTDNNEKTRKLRQSFVKYIVKKTMRGEELLSKHGHFNWSLLYGDKDAPPDKDANFVRDTDDAGGDNDDEPSPMSTGDLDVGDGDEIDEEDSSNTIRVGENLGLI